MAMELERSRAIKLEETQRVSLFSGLFYHGQQLLVYKTHNLSGSRALFLDYCFESVRKMR